MRPPEQLLLKRRSFLLFGLGAMGSFLSSGCSDRGAGPAADALLASIVAIVRKQLAYLSVTEADLNAFAQDYLREHGVPPKIHSMGAMFAWVYSYTPLFSLPVQALAGLRELEVDVAEQFLLSSDFFWNQPRQMTVKYLGYFSPYSKICFNPFARL